MIPATIIAGVLIGIIIGLAIAGWHHARSNDVPPPPESSCLGLTNGRPGIWLDSYHARLLKPILKDLGREVL
jgi:hypothetical protein